jgi:hypothetical protein
MLKGEAMKNADLVRIIEELRAHVERRRRERPDADEADIVHKFLARHDLTPTEHSGILDEYRRKAARED